MSHLDDLFSSVHALPRADKLLLIQFLAAEVAREEGMQPPVASAAYPVWSPHEAFNGAATLLRVLEQEHTAR